MYPAFKIFPQMSSDSEIKGAYINAFCHHADFCRPSLSSDLPLVKRRQIKVKEMTPIREKSIGLLFIFSAVVSPMLNHILT